MSRFIGNPIAIAMYSGGHARSHDHSDNLDNDTLNPLSIQLSAGDVTIDNGWVDLTGTISRGIKAKSADGTAYTAIIANGGTWNIT